MFPAEALAGEPAARAGIVPLLFTDRRGAASAAAAEVRTASAARASPAGPRSRRTARFRRGSPLGFVDSAAPPPADAGAGVVIGFGGYASRADGARRRRAGIADADPRAERRARPRQPPARRPRRADRHRFERRLGAVGGGRGRRSCAPAIRCARRSPPATGAAYSRPGADGPIRLLVLGGSQGARVFGDMVPDARRRACPGAARAASSSPSNAVRRTLAARARRPMPARHSGRARQLLRRHAPSGWRRRIW